MLQLLRKRNETKATPGSKDRKISHKFNELADNVAYLQLFIRGGCSLRSPGRQRSFSGCCSPVRSGNVLFNFRRLAIFKTCQRRTCLGFYAVELSWIFASVFLFLHESAAALRGNRKDAPPLSNCLRTHCVTVGLPACLYVYFPNFILLCLACLYFVNF